MSQVATFIAMCNPQPWGQAHQGKLPTMWQKQMQASTTLPCLARKQAFSKTSRKQSLAWKLLRKGSYMPDGCQQTYHLHACCRAWDDLAEHKDGMDIRSIVAELRQFLTENHVGVRIGRLYSKGILHTNRMLRLLGLQGDEPRWVKCDEVDPGSCVDLLKGRMPSIQEAVSWPCARAHRKGMLLRPLDGRQYQCISAIRTTIRTTKAAYTSPRLPIQPS